MTLWYRPPEILLGRTEYTSAVDLWSVGCIFYELLTKIPLFMGTSEIDQLRKIFEIMGVPNELDLPEIKDKHFDFPPPSPDNPPKTFKDLSDGANFDENERDLLMKMLIYNPSKRITAKAALSHPYFDDLL